MNVVPVSTDGAGCQPAGGPEGPASDAVMDENWDEEILDSRNDTSPFGN